MATEIGLMAPGRAPVQAGLRRSEGSRAFTCRGEVYGFAQLPDVTSGRKEVKRLTSESFVPVLVLDDGEVIKDSENIVALARNNPQE